MDSLLCYLCRMLHTISSTLDSTWPCAHQSHCTSFTWSGGDVSSTMLCFVRDEARSIADGVVANHRTMHDPRMQIASTLYIGCTWTFVLSWIYTVTITTDWKLTEPDMATSEVAGPCLYGTWEREHVETADGPIILKGYRIHFNKSSHTSIIQRPDK